MGSSSAGAGGQAGQGMDNGGLMQAGNLFTPNLLQSLFGKPQGQADGQGMIQPGTSFGNIFSGTTEFQGNVGNKTPDQMSALSQMLNQPQDYESFSKSIVEPSTKMFNEQLVPGIQERFESMGASSSGALNRALAEAAKDVSSSVAPQYMNYLQQGNQNKLAGIGQNTMQPMIQNQEGILGQIMQLLGQAARAYSSMP